MGKLLRFGILPLVMSLISAVIWAFVGGLIYNALSGKLPMPLVIAIYMTGLALMLFAATVLSNIFCQNEAPRYKWTFIVIGAVFLCSMLFEFLYELNPAASKPDEPTSYIFLIDDSGSMSGNDPNFVRNDAIYDVMQSCESDFPYSIYSFTEECRQISPLAAASTAQKMNYGFVSSGGTDIQGAIEYVLNDIKSGALDAGDSPRILLLSDGLSFYSAYRSVVRDCVRNNVSISAVGFGEADKNFLQLLAEDTRGAFVWIDDINQLSSAMSTAASSVSGGLRNLLGYRPYMHNDTLFSVLRIVFMLILSVGFVLIKNFMFGTFCDKKIPLCIFIVFAIIGALAPEVGINLLRLDDGFTRAVMCVCFSLLFGFANAPGDTPDNISITKFFL